MRATGLNFVLACACVASSLACEGTKETTFVKYLDNQSGVSIVVRETVSQTEALAWLSTLVANEAGNTAEQLLSSSGRLGLVRTSVGDFGEEPPHVPGRVASEYTDSRTGKQILVLGGTPQATAAGWLRDAVGVSSVGPLTRLVEAYHGQGLLSATVTLEGVGKNGTVVTVSWRDIHRNWKPPTGVMDLTDQSTGRRLSVRADARGTEAWMTELVNAKGEPDLYRLLTNAHQNGLLSARMDVQNGTVDYSIRTLWDE